MDSRIIAFAIESHQKTNHLYDDKPYSVHLLMAVMNGMKYINLIPENYRDIVLHSICLHDTIEDCRLTYNDIKSVAGEEVADIVYAVTNEKGKTRKERANDKYYEGIRNAPFAIFVKLCDRLANVQYSKDTYSKMYEVYKKENDDFLEQLFADNNINDNYYKEMVYDLKSLLSYVKID